MAKTNVQKHRPKVVTLRPGNGQTITREVDPARAPGHSGAPDAPPAVGAQS